MANAKDPSPILLASIDVIVLVSLAGCLGWLWWSVFDSIFDMQQSQLAPFPTKEALVLVVMLIIIVIGVTLIRDSRPYSASLVGRMITLLGIGLILIAMTILVLLCKALVLTVS